MKRDGRVLRETRGVRNAALRKAAANRKTPAGQYGRRAAPSEQALRACIAEQTCPWCGRDGFTSLACHTNRAHGVSADELRRLAGLPRRWPTCAPELSEVRSRSLENRDLVQFITPEHRRQAAETRKTRMGDEDRRQVAEQLRRARPAAMRALTEARADPQFSAAVAAKSSATHRSKRAERLDDPGTVCSNPACRVLFCTWKPGTMENKRRTCSPECERERHRLAGATSLSPEQRRANAAAMHTPEAKTKAAAARASRTVCKKGLHRLEGDNLIVRPNGARECRRCRNDRQNATRARRIAQGTWQHS